MRLIVLFFMCLLTMGSLNAKEVNKSLAANPDAVQQQIDSMGLTQMPESTANEMRGGGGIFFLNILTGAVLGTATMKAIYGGSYCASCGGKWSIVIPWFLKPIKAY